VCLQLKYSFRSRPSPILASPKTGAQNVIALDISITLAAGQAVTLRSIRIKIPVGSDCPQTLSTAPHLPHPVPAAAGGWSILPPTGSDLILRPASGESAGFPGSMKITLSPIPVNTKAPASVPISITETPASGSPVTDSTTHSLDKEAADCVITNFDATPDTLTDLDKRVMLTWTVSDAGKDLGYALHSDSWWPKDCLKKLECFTDQNGRDGVRSAPIKQGPTATFWLDAIDKHDATPSVVKTVTTTVLIDVPQISDSFDLRRSRSGRLVALHWLAWDADACEVDLDGDPLDPAAPLDTLGPGWFWLLGGPDKQDHHFDVFAHAANRRDCHAPDLHVATHAPTTIELGQGAPLDSMALARSGSVALVTAWGALRAIDLSSATLEPDAVVALGRNPAVATTPDGALALVTDDATPALTVLDMATQKPQPAAIALPFEASNVAVAPGGTLAVVAGTLKNTLQAVDIPRRETSGTPLTLQEPTDMAFTPDGDTLLVASRGGFITPIDVKTWTAGKAMMVTLTDWSTGQEREYLAGLSAVTVTPDGHTMLAVDAEHSMLYAFDLKTKKLAWSAQVGSSPSRLVITADSRLALVTSTQDGKLIAFDLQRKQPIGEIALEGGLGAIALAPDTSVVAVANWSVGTVTLI
jgi:DNA-binding beta-propeller fold protein YncE